MPPLRIRLASLVLALLFLSGCTSLRQPLAARTQAAELLHEKAVMADGYTLPYDIWQPRDEAKAVVVALHGFNDYRAAFAKVGPYLAARGIVTYAFDQRGFGDTAYRGFWPGADVLALDARELLLLARERYPQLPIYLLGESMGGAVAIRAVSLGLPTPADGVVLVAPAVWSRLTMPWYQRLGLELAVRLVPGWKPTGQSLEIWPSDNIEMLRELGRDPRVIKATRIDTVYGLVNLMDLALASAPRLQLRGLVLYGERDELIPKLPTCQMLDALPAQPPADWRFALYPDGYHMLLRDLQAQRVLDDLAHWLLSAPGQLPSGQELARPRWDSDFCQAM